MTLFRTELTGYILAKGLCSQVIRARKKRGSGQNGNWPEPVSALRLWTVEQEGLRFRTSNQDTFWCARDGGYDGTWHVVVGFVCATQGWIEKRRGSGQNGNWPEPVLALRLLIVEKEGVKFRTSNLDTFGCARDGGSNGTQHVVVGFVCAMQWWIEKRRGWGQNGNCKQSCVVVALNWTASMHPNVHCNSYLGASPRGHPRSR